MDGVVRKEEMKAASFITHAIDAPRPLPPSPSLSTHFSPPIVMARQVRSHATWACGDGGGKGEVQRLIF